MALQFSFDNTYARLPDRFFARLAPLPVAAPGLLALNSLLAKELGVDPTALGSPEGVEVLAGNMVPNGAEPLAQVYAGHQFGKWVPQLGDGRAILLGEIVGSNGLRRDIQLKGAGTTPFSRLGDGRAWLGPVLREYLVSEAMHALRVPTTRALAAVATGEPVLRENVLPGAVLTRVAASHIRVGTFQYFRARGDVDALRALVDYANARHFPEAEGPLELLDNVVDAQARLIALWMGIGFVHGAMNTDNMGVAGETIDYGPCAFLDIYQPGKAFSSIDFQGRYAYDRQPLMAAWNLAQLASCLLPLIEDSEEASVAAAMASVNRFASLFQDAWLNVFRSKLGLTTQEADDADLINRLLALMAEGQADFTRTFRGLANGTAKQEFSDPALFEVWAKTWVERRTRDDIAEGNLLMAATNPAVIPRNHRIYEAVTAAVSGDLSLFERLSSAFAKPFQHDAELEKAPAPDETVDETFCGT